MELKRASKFGGRAPRARHEGRLLARGQRQPGPGSKPVVVIILGCLIVGAIAGFGYSMDRQLRGGLLAQRAEAAQRPDWVSMESLPPHVPQAFLTVVDAGFTAGNRGRDPGERSSLPRDLVRQVHMLQPGVSGNARERIMAPVLSQHLTDRDLLELYLNRIYLGESKGYDVYGIYYAADEYFGKQPSDLTVGEAATLAGLLLPPRIADPAERAGAVGVRRNEVLRSMLRNEEITEQQYQQAIGERLAFQPGIGEMPMSRRLLSADDTAVIRLPPAYRPLPPDSTAE